MSSAAFHIGTTKSAWKNRRVVSGGAVWTGNQTRRDSTVMLGGLSSVETEKLPEYASLNIPERTAKFLPLVFEEPVYDRR